MGINLNTAPNGILLGPAGIGGGLKMLTTSP